MYNSFLIAYRNRIEHLNYCLNAISLSSDVCDFKDFDINIVNLDTKNNLSNFLSKYFSLNINYKFVYDGDKHFAKSKALNMAFSLSNSKFVTVLDVDCVISPYYFNGLLDFYKNNSEKSKLCYRVRMLTEDQTQNIKDDFGKEIFDNKIIKLCNTYHKADELFTKKMVKMKSPGSDNIKGKCLGCGIFTINSKSFNKIGGFDEKFVGHGYEDTDFNYRLFAYMRYRDSHLLTNQKYNIFHLYHKKTFSKEYLKRQQYNKRLFLYNKRNDIVKANQ